VLSVQLRSGVESSEAPGVHLVLTSRLTRTLTWTRPTQELEPARPSQRLLATVLFTDIVDSTERARAVGDQRWRELLELHDEAARRLIDQAGGRLIKSTGDGILAVFDGPGWGLRCVLALRAELRASAATSNLRPIHVEAAASG
jgi:class 3 adenylate cyclase